jgi:serine/threonine-protein kinase RsbW
MSGDPLEPTPPPTGGLAAADAATDDLAADDLAADDLAADDLAADDLATGDLAAIADRLARLQRITASLVTAATTDEMARALSESMTAAAPGGHAAGGLNWCQVWLVRDGQVELVSASDGAPPAATTAVALDGPSGLAGCAREQQAYFARGPARDGTCPNTGEEPPGPMISAGMVPIVLRQRCLGVLVVAYPVDHDVDATERSFLTTMVHQVAQALERAQLYSQQAAQAKVSAFLADSAQIVAEGKGFDDTLGRLADLALNVLGDICLIDVIDDQGVIRRKVAQHRKPEWQSLADQLGTNFVPDPAGAHPALSVIRTGKTSWSPVMTDEFLRQTTRGRDHYELVKQLQFRSYLAVPLLTGGEVLGSLTLVSAGRIFDADDVEFAERLAQQVAAVVDNAQRYDATLQTSHILQQSLLPRAMPQVEGMEIQTRYLPATRGLEVGGDCYDLVVLPSRRSGFMIADVAGHDRHAAAAMGQLRSAARALSGQVHSPSELIAALQWSWDLLGFDRIATAIFGRLDPNNGDLILASAGHPPPLLVREGEASFLPVEPSTPLGAPAAPAINWTGHLEPGPVLLLYTDGVLDNGGQHDGWDKAMERLAAVASQGEATPAAICDRVLAMLPAHRTDDVALLALQLTQ